MISSLTGQVKSVQNTSVVIEVGGVGILVLVPARQSGSFLVGKILSLHTSLIVREDSLTLFGFESSEERDLFDLLQTVTGIGPKVAQSALSAYEVPQLVQAIAREENSLLERIPGLGKKGAARLILELKEKVEHLSHAPFDSRRVDWREPLHEALSGLGFTARESNEALNMVAGQYQDADQRSLEELLKYALQIRGRR
jgi:Holliday junction DNA helicase RuvA